MSLGTVLITGGSGSFGRAFISYLLKHDLADRIVSISRNAEMRYRLEQDMADPRLIVVPGDVRYSADLEAAYDGPVDVLIHAAAEKHVGTGQTHSQYVQAINVGGAKHVIGYARRQGVQTVIALSTDKACAPINRYGQSKLDAEALFVRATSEHGPRFSVVRYGNVIGSSGSVLPLFVRQRTAGRLTVTDLRMTRFFMSLSPDSDCRVYQEPGCRAVMSAVELVMYAIEHGRGSEVLIPTIPSGTIQNLAQEVGPNCRIEEIGIRPGEKLHEELIASDESRRAWVTTDGVFILMPDDRVPSQPARRVPEGFTYTSADSPQPMRLEEGVVV